MRIPRTILLTAVAGLAFPSIAFAQTSILSNGGFETPGLFPVLIEDWDQLFFGDKYDHLDNTVDNPLLIRTGRYSAKTFGQFISAPSATFYFQQNPAVPGNRYEASVWGLHFSGDPFDEADLGTPSEKLSFALANIVFRDSMGDPIEVTSHSPTKADTNFDVWYETNYTVVAPAGAVTVEYQLGSFQLNNQSLGAAYLDDADLVDLGPNMDPINLGFDTYVDTGPPNFARDACCVPGWTRGGANTFVSGDFPNNDFDSDNDATRTGNSSLLIFGSFEDDGGVPPNPVDSTNVIFQDVPASPGEYLRLSAAAAHQSGDPLVGDNNVFMSLEFRDGADQILEITRLKLLDSDLGVFPTDEYFPGELFATAPPNTATARIQLGFFQQLDNAGAAFVDDTAIEYLVNEGLVNPGFESFVPGGDFNPEPTLPLPNWGNFGFNGGVSVDPNIGHATDPGSGEFSAFMFGQFPGDNSANDTVIFQDIPAPVAPGEEVTVTAQVKQSINDPIAAGNALSVSIEWFDAGGARASLGSSGTVILDSSSPQDIFFEASYSAIAPASTASARVNFVYTQVNEGGGAALIDDVTFAITPGPACAGDVNGDGVTDVFDFSDLAANFGAGPDATREQGDLNGDGVVDVFDFGDLAADFGCGTGG
jgi:hypothetical protein